MTPLGSTMKPSGARLWMQLWKGLGTKERRRIKSAVAAMLVESLLTALTPLFVGMFVDAVIKDGRLVGLSEAWIPLVLLAASMTVISAMGVIQHQQVHTVTTAFTSSMRRRIYAALLRWELVRFVDDAKGAIYGRANRSIEGAERLIKLGAAQMLPAVLVTVFGVILALAKFHALGLVMIAVVPTGFALVRWQINSQNGIRVQLNNAKERIDGDVSAWLAGIDVIRTLGVERFFNSRIAERAGHLRQTELAHHIAMSRFDALKALNESIWLIATLAAAIGFGALSSPGDLAGVVLLYFAITKPLRELHRVIDESSESALQAQNLQDDLAAPHDPSYVERSDVENGAVHSPSVEGAPPAVQLLDLTFAHPGANRPVLQGLSASIAAGERVGIVGASGCGKSTLLKILARLTHGHTGEIRLHGRSLETVGRQELVDEVGYVGQRPLLFQGTVRENLTLGRPDITDHDIILACTRANIHNDIATMDQGYDTTIGEEGARLSGGQSQRLCLARALIRTPPVLLLDEPTSALDGPSQAVVQQAIDHLDDVTMLVVAHRLSTLQTMDRIIVLKDGHVAEDGKYDELVSSGGLFANMLESERRSP